MGQVVGRPVAEEERLDEGGGEEERTARRILEQRQQLLPDEREGLGDVPLRATGRDAPNSGFRSPILAVADGSPGEASPCRTKPKGLRTPRPNNWASIAASSNEFGANEPLHSERICPGGRSSTCRRKQQGAPVRRGPLRAGLDRSSVPSASIKLLTVAPIRYATVRSDRRMLDISSSARGLGLVDDEQHGQRIEPAPSVPPSNPDLNQYRLCEM